MYLWHRLGQSSQRQVYPNLKEVDTPFQRSHSRHLGLALVAVHDVELGAGGGIHQSGIDGVGGGNAARTADHLALLRILQSLDRRGVPDDDDGDFLGGAADPMDLERRLQKCQSRTRHLRQQP